MRARDLVERTSEASEGEPWAERSDAPVPSPSSPSPSSSSRGRPGPLAGRYRSLFVVGRGGMGTVEAALELEPPESERELEESSSGRRSSDGARGYERIVALKRLLPDSAHDKRRVDMFLREARLATMLDHPNIVRAYDYGELDGELYLAMEYVEGQPLSRVLDALAEAKQRMPTNVAVWVLSEVCRGLHAAHELADPTTGLPLQLVHRDVSPQNVMIGYDGRVRLLDFGIAKIETESVTKTGEVKGKTAYMSPEQAMGEPLDRRSDLFSVGAVLFECLALRRMWGDGTDMEVIRKLALESPPSLDSSAADLPDGLSELHERLVAREAKNRPSTAIEVAGDLVHFVDDPEAASEHLREILEQHFAAQAKAQQARLTAALNEVAPDQAAELRESMLPTGSSTPMRRRSSLSTPAAAAPERAAPAPPAAKAPSKTAIGLGGIGLALVMLVVWRALSGSPSPNPVPTAVPTVTAPATLATSPPVASAAMVAPSDMPGASGTHEPAARPAATAPAATSSSLAAGPRASASLPARATTTPARVPSALPIPSVKPPDLDEKPF